MNYLDSDLITSAAECKINEKYYSELDEDDFQNNTNKLWMGEVRSLLDANDIEHSTFNNNDITYKVINDKILIFYKNKVKLVIYPPSIIGQDIAAQTKIPFGNHPKKTWVNYMEMVNYIRRVCIKIIQCP